MNTNTIPPAEDEPAPTDESNQEPTTEELIPDDGYEVDGDDPAEGEGEPASDGEGEGEGEPEGEGEGESEGESEESDEAPRTFTQQELDNILTHRLSGERLKQEELKTEIRRRDEAIAEMREHQEAEQKRSQRVYNRLKDDDLLPDEVRPHLEPKAIPEHQQQSAALQYHDFPVQQFNVDSQELSLRMQETLKERSSIVGQRVVMMIEGGKIPKDVITIAAAHPKGVEMIEAITNNDDVRTRLQLAMYEAQNHNDFKLKFDEVANTLNPTKGANGQANGTNGATNGATKPKPTPKEPLRSRPGANVTEDDVVWLD